MSRSLNSQTSVLGCDDDLALLYIDGLNLLLPQGAIRSLEPVLDVERCGENEAIAGFLFFDGKRWPVYCLSKDFTALGRIPEARRVCVVFSAARGYLCLLCDSVRMLKREDAKTMPLPGCMRAGNNPLQGLAILDQAMGCLTAVDDLMAYVQTLNASEVSETDTNMPDYSANERLG